MKSFIFSSLAVVAFIANHTLGLERCGVPDPSSELIEVHNSALASFRADHPNQKRADYYVPTYVHVVSTDEKAGRYTQNMINSQMSTINIAYLFTGLQFNLVDTEFVTNDEWARSSPGSAAERSMRVSLQKYDGYQALNLYFLSDIGQERAESLLGYCRFPVSNPGYDEVLLDGCLNGADTLPGGDAYPYNEGYTAVHEIGHWLALYHVFQGLTCYGQGDFVTDTPAQRTSTSGCPAFKDTCPDFPGNDSIHNFMDYSDDSCLTQFTIGQDNRAGDMYATFRAGMTQPFGG